MLCPPESRSDPLHHPTGEAGGDLQMLQEVHSRVSAFCQKVSTELNCFWWRKDFQRAAVAGDLSHTFSQLSRLVENFRLPPFSSVEGEGELLEPAHSSPSVDRQRRPASSLEEEQGSAIAGKTEAEGDAREREETKAGGDRETVPVRLDASVSGVEGGVPSPSSSSSLCPSGVSAQAPESMGKQETERGQRQVEATEAQPLGADSALSKKRRLGPPPSPVCVGGEGKTTGRGMRLSSSSCHEGGVRTRKVTPKGRISKRISSLRASISFANSCRPTGRNGRGRLGISASSHPSLRGGVPGWGPFGSLSSCSDLMDWYEMEAAGAEGLSSDEEGEGDGGEGGAASSSLEGGAVDVNGLNWKRQTKSVREETEEKSLKGDVHQVGEGSGESGESATDVRDMRPGSNGTSDRGDTALQVEGGGLHQGPQVTSSHEFQKDPPCPSVNPLPHVPPLSSHFLPFPLTSADSGPLVFDFPDEDLDDWGGEWGQGQREGQEERAEDAQTSAVYDQRQNDILDGRGDGERVSASVHGVRETEQKQEQRESVTEVESSKSREQKSRASLLGEGEGDGGSGGSRDGVGDGKQSDEVTETASVSGKSPHTDSRTAISLFSSLPLSKTSPEGKAVGAGGGGEASGGCPVSVAPSRPPPDHRTASRSETLYLGTPSDGLTERGGGEEETGLDGESPLHLFSVPPTAPYSREESALRGQEANRMSAHSNDLHPNPPAPLVPRHDPYSNDALECLPAQTEEDSCGGMGEGEGTERVRGEADLSAASGLAGSRQSPLGSHGGVQRASAERASVSLGLTASVAVDEGGDLGEGEDKACLNGEEGGDGEGLEDTGGDGEIVVCGRGKGGEGREEGDSKELQRENAHEISLPEGLHSDLNSRTLEYRSGNPEKKESAEMNQRENQEAAVSPCESEQALHRQKDTASAYGDDDSIPLISEPADGSLSLGVLGGDKDLSSPFAEDEGEDDEHCSRSHETCDPSSSSFCPPMQLEGSLQTQRDAHSSFHPFAPPQEGGGTERDREETVKNDTVYQTLPPSHPTSSSPSFQPNRNPSLSPSRPSSDVLFLDPSEKSRDCNSIPQEEPYKDETESLHLQLHEPPPSMETEPEGEGSPSRPAGETRVSHRDYPMQLWQHSNSIGPPSVYQQQSESLFSLPSRPGIPTIKATRCVNANCHTSTERKEKHQEAPQSPPPSSLFIPEVQSDQCPHASQSFSTLHPKSPKREGSSPTSPQKQHTSPAPSKPIPLSVSGFKQEEGQDIHNNNKRSPEFTRTQEPPQSFQHEEKAEPPLVRASAPAPTNKSPPPPPSPSDSDVIILSDRPPARVPRIPLAPLALVNQPKGPSLPAPVARKGNTKKGAGPSRQVQARIEDVFGGHWGMMRDRQAVVKDSASQTSRGRGKDSQGNASSSSSSSSFSMRSLTDAKKGQSGEGQKDAEADSGVCFVDCTAGEGDTKDGWDENRLLNQPIAGNEDKAEEGPCIVTTSIPMRLKNRLQDALRPPDSLSGSLAESPVQEEATHMVVPSDENGRAKGRSVRFLLGLLRGLEVLSPAWVEASLDAARLFHSVAVSLDGNSLSKKVPPYSDLKTLVLFGGGACVRSKEIVAAVSQRNSGRDMTSRSACSFSSIPSSSSSCSSSQGEDWSQSVKLAVVLLDEYTTSRSKAEEFEKRLITRTLPGKKAAGPSQANRGPSPAVAGPEGAASSSSSVSAAAREESVTGPGSSDPIPECVFRVAPVKWLLDCISTYKLLPIPLSAGEEGSADKNFHFLISSFSFVLSFDPFRSLSHLEAYGD
uniref:BRCT domain-containing protein n=1 Tax=Chromera velia CCMP2878 TaxID=1169474 RepID=A0A0G4HEH1_9ALVE|eukprot:Cvel_978.t1-p1 / transcript=Cvel_978.t1 / gene=Cvel_978 / organism=Chromera_velia_CCMP2878 / gene_product=hypothetical protein / transcript_product=hypothetical protein / location=Cvel_scaffold31:139368-150634(+) / protein_length=1784 / sequence_SO=supercontig / SO=protein_coding / is_pseudo=false